MADAPASPSASLAGAHIEHYSRRNPWLTAVIATLPTFMEVLNTSVANVTLPHISGSLSAGLDDSTWVLTSYLVANAIIMPLSGWLSALMGRKNFYIACVIAFTIASVLCGFATSLPMLVVFRLLQGLGGGGLQPITQAILVDTFPPHKRAMGMAVYGMTVVVAPIIGPILGGWIAESYSWRWIFFINAPIGVVSAALAAWAIADPPYHQRRTTTLGAVDWASIALLTLWLGCMQMALDLGERLDWFDSDLIFVLAVASCAAAVLFLARQWRSPEPIVNLRLLKERNFALSAGIMVLFGFMLYATTVVLPLFMQSVLGYTSMRSGLALAPGGVAVMALMPLVGSIGPRLDVRWIIAGGYAVIGWSLFIMAGFDAEVDFGAVAWARAVQGLGLAFTFVPINTLAYAYVAKEARNEASAILSLTRNIGASMGIAISTAMIARSTQAHRVYMVAHATPYDPAYTAMVDAAAGAQVAASGDPAQAALAAQAQVSQLIQLHAHTAAYVEQFLILGVGVLAMIPLVLVMRRPRPAPAAAAKP